VRIALLTNQDLDAVPFPADDWPCDPRPFVPEATWDVITLTRGEAATRLPPLRDRYDVFFNLCDGAADQADVPGIDVVHTLESMGVPFTGADSAFYEPTRAQMKRAARSVGVRVPRGGVAKTTHDVDKAAERLTFPLFVKHHNSYASVGITRQSKVATPAGLRRQARRMMERFGFCLIEEYIDGDECTVLVAEDADAPRQPVTYTPMRYAFPAGESFKHEKLKWEDYAGLGCEPVTDAALASRLRRAAARTFVALGGTSFGRCDLRVDRKGRVYLLEINPNCGVFYPPTDPGSADLCLLHDPQGHRGFARRLIATALSRRERRLAVG
jgi:D-alanine-D-alanine ligase